MPRQNKVTLYYHELSQPSRAVLTFLECAELPYEAKTIEVVQNENRKPFFRLVNPNGSVPAIVDIRENGVPFPIYESGAIIRYLCNRYLEEDNEFYPRNNPALKAKIEEMMTFYHRRVRPGARVFYYAMIAPFSGLQDKFDHDEDVKITHEICQEVDDILAKNGGWLVEKGKFTIADILCLAEIITFTFGDVDIEGYEHIKQWMIEIFKRKGAKNSHAFFKKFVFLL